MQICKTYRWTVSENGGNKKIMKYAVVYESATGNTKMLADEIINILGDAECVYFGTVEEKYPEHDEGGRYCFHWLLDG